MLLSRLKQPFQSMGDITSGMSIAPARRMENKRGVTLINVFTPKAGKEKDFARTQIRDYEKFGRDLDGAIRNHFYISVNDKNQQKLINVAEFESLDVFYETTQSEDFKKHVEDIGPFLDDGDPMLGLLLWQSEDRTQNDVEHLLEQVYPERVDQNLQLISRLGERRLKKSA
jgi:heme-degrading monooxygenase HmoA